MTLSADRVLSASAAWISPWLPPQAVHYDLGWLEYYCQDGIATVKRVAPGNLTAVELVRRVLAELWRQDATEAQWRVGPQFSPAGVDTVLLKLGARIDSTVDICAFSLDDVLLGDTSLAGATATEAVETGASARQVRSRDDVARYERTSALAWGYPPPSEADIDETFTQLSDGYFIGYWREMPAGAGGYGLVGDVARFWGTAVIPEFRGRGVYRALVAARMADARRHGAAFALVHALGQTSSPILQRLGFTVYGHQKILAIRRDS